MRKTLAQLATAGVIAAGGVLAAVVPAAASPGVVAAPAAHWQIYAVYDKEETCEAVGKALVKNKVVDGYKCEWDSPKFALYVKY